jgi:hypothetical protein
MKFRKKPVVIEAHYFQTPENTTFICDWIRAGGGVVRTAEDGLWIHTLEGRMLARPGDWIIKGVKGEFYPCKNDIFLATYEAAP